MEDSLDRERNRLKAYQTALEERAGALLEAARENRREAERRICPTVHDDTVPAAETGHAFRGADLDNLELIAGKLDAMEAESGGIEEAEERDDALMDSEIGAPSVGRHVQSAAPTLEGPLERTRRSLLHDKAAELADFARNEKDLLLTPLQRLEQYKAKLAEAVEAGPAVMTQQQADALARAKAAEFMHVTPARGLFNIAAIQSLLGGSGSVAERTAKAAEKTAENTGKIATEAQRGPMAFAP